MSIRRLISRGRALATLPLPRLPPERQGPRLLWIAEPVLLLATRLRATTSIADLGRLRERLSEILLDFQARAHSQGIAGARVSQASEVLGALIAHIVTNMPWGAEADWPPLSATGPVAGRRPAQRLLDTARSASSDMAMGELISVAISLGFDRRSRGAEDPYVEQLLALLAAPGSKTGLHAERGLSPEGRSPLERGGATSWLPLWVSSLVVAALLATLYFALEVSLGIKSDRVYARMAAMSVPEAPARRQPAPSPRLAGALSQQIAAHVLAVRDEIDRSVVVLPGSTLFQAGTATLQPEATELLQPIATVLQHTPGRIRVIGHTDGGVARSARYPSDWEFSVDRARVVDEALRGLGVEAVRLGYDGRANIEPLDASEQARFARRDGRIEIVLLVGR